MEHGMTPDSKQKTKLKNEKEHPKRTRRAPSRTDNRGHLNLASLRFMAMANTRPLG